MESSSTMDLHRVAVANQTDVALSLTKSLISGVAKGVNFVFSPPSIHILLSLIAAGARGRTLDDLLLFLKSNRVDDLNSLAAHLGEVALADGASCGGPSLSFVNGVWIDRRMPLKKEFKQVLEGVYKANTQQVDFQNEAAEVVREVNSWVEKETNDLIKDILDRDNVDRSTRFILVNAVYFKGVWAEEFSALDTEYDDFHLLGGSTVRAPFMTSHEMQLLQEFDGFKVLQLPYKQGQDDKRQLFSMCMFLPNAKDGLPALADQLGSGTSGFIDEHIPQRKVVVGDFRIPKFKISFGFKVCNVLKDLGLTSPFSGAHQGFADMVDSPIGQELYVSGIFHRSCIEVNEQGTEAAAATALVGVDGCPFVRPGIPRIDFVADHPFLFVIRENVTGVVLFIGHVLNPVDQGHS